MEIPVIVEPVADNGFRARSGEPFVLTAEAPSSAEALDKLRALLEQRVRNGVCLTSLTIPDQNNPWNDFRGIFEPGDPDVQEWRQIMADNRRKMDADPNIP